MNFIRKYWLPLTIFMIMIAAIVFRLYLYGDPRLSIGMGDTQSYIDSSRVPVFSWASFTGRRLFTMNLIYHVFIKDPIACPLPITIDPSKLQHANLGFQACFDGIAFLQNLLSMLGWSLLAWELGSRLKTAFYKILITIIILSFAISPQIAEWDSVLSSESLTLSLFPICLALLLEIAFQFPDSGNGNKGKTIVILSVWLIVFTLWVFVQDANLYFVLIILLLGVPLIIKDRFRNKAWGIACFFLIGILALGLISSANSTRWQPSLQHSYERLIFPYPSRLNFIKGWGAPDPGASGFAQWFDKKAPGVYLLFLASHPGFVISNAFQYMYMFTSDFLQPYFNTQSINFNSTLITLGRMLHPESGAVYLMDVLLLGSIIHTALTSRDRTISTWAWIGIWLFLSSTVSLFIRYFGDMESVLRHIFPAVEFFRLLLWILLMIQVDLLAIKANRSRSNYSP
jgi:hypothetical protein